jgi:hypothetical protein
LFWWLLLLGRLAALDPTGHRVVWHGMEGRGRTRVPSIFIVLIFFIRDGACLRPAP